MMTTLLSPIVALNMMTKIAAVVAVVAIVAIIILKKRSS